MKLGEALAEKKRMQVRLAKCNELLKKSYYYKSKPDFNYGKLKNEIILLTVNLRELKLKIMKTNLTTQVKHEDKDISIAELIIRLGDIRSEISCLNELYKSERDSLYSLRHSDEDELKMQVPPSEVQDDITSLNKEKTKLDALLQHTNWTVELI